MSNGFRVSQPFVLRHFYMEYGGKFEVADEDGKNPLSIAAHRCEGDVVRYLLAMQRAAQQTKSRASDRKSEKLERDRIQHHDIQIGQVLSSKRLRGCNAPCKLPSCVSSACAYDYSIRRFQCVLV